jgi:hypothetical protein
MKRMGLRRDTYLNHVLSGEVDLLRRSPGNSLRGETLLKLIRGLDERQRKKVGVTLDRDLIQSINEVCELKRVPRDLFFEQVIRFLDEGEDGAPSPLNLAENIIDSPREEWGQQTLGKGVPFADLMFSDDDVDDLILNMKLERE